MRIYADCYELMSETARNLYEMGQLVKPKTYQNKNIEGQEGFSTREINCEQYCLVTQEKLDSLFVYAKDKDWADAEFEERVACCDERNGDMVNPGIAWMLRRDIWEEFLNGNGKFDYTYNERMGLSVRNPVKDEYKYVPYLIAVRNLLIEDPGTRKAVLSIYDPETDGGRMDGGARIPCSMYYNFLIRKNQNGEDVLNLVYHQRSSDFITHFGNDVYLALRLLNFMSKAVSKKPGYLYHTIDSLHCYDRDLATLKKSLREMGY